jgi:hypothetical protein
LKSDNVTPPGGVVFDGVGGAVVPHEVARNTRAHRNEAAIFVFIIQ